MFILVVLGGRGEVVEGGDYFLIFAVTWCRARGVGAVNISVVTLIEVKLLNVSTLRVVIGKLVVQGTNI